LFYEFFQPHSFQESLKPFHGSGDVKGELAGARSPKDLVGFWSTFAETLEEARPRCRNLTIEHAHPNDTETTWEPDKPDKPRVDHLKLSGLEFSALRESHAYMINQSVVQAPSLYYERGTKGIVMTAGPRYIPILLVSLRLIRRSGSQLPVEVFLGSWDEYDATICEETLPRLGARCRIISEVYDNAPGVASPKSYQFKIFSILFSSFEDVLFLDADAFPGRNPDGLFATEPYTSHGLVVWPDIFANTASSMYFEIAGIAKPPPVSLRLSSESGQLLLSKKRHAASLLLMTYYNYFGPEYYYPLLCQNSHGAGDKETFIHAAMALDLPFWDVRERPWCLGTWKNGEFKMVAMAQADCSDDWKIATGRNTSADPSIARPMFVHNHFEKLNPESIIREDGPTRDGSGEYQRMWGSKDTIMQRFGRDLEQTLWQEVLTSGCETGASTCSKIKNYYTTVYV